jgi:hypothetical protein
MGHAAPGSRVEPPLLRTAALTLTTVIVAVIALDDITTDDAASFGFERFALLGCWTWLLVVSARLMREHRSLGLISVGLLGFAAPALRAIGPGIQPGLSFEYVVTVVVLAWFAGLAVVLAARGWRSRGRPATRTGH